MYGAMSLFLAAVTVLPLACAATPRPTAEPHHAARLQVVHAQPYGINAVRVRLFAQQPTAHQLANPGYLLPDPAVDREYATAGRRLYTSGETASTVSSGNIEASLTASQGVRVRRISDGKTLLAQEAPISAGTTGVDGRAQLNASLRVEIDAAQLRFYGGGCKCGGGFNRQDGHDGGAMLNGGRTGSEDLHFGVPIGRAASPRIPGLTGGLGSQW